MKLYFILSLLLSITNSALSMDEHDDDAEAPISMTSKQSNQANFILHLQIDPEIQYVLFSILPIDEQRRLNLDMPKKTNKNIICLANNAAQHPYIYLLFSSPKPIDCSQATIKQMQGSPFARIIIPYQHDQAKSVSIYNKRADKRKR